MLKSPRKNDWKLTEKSPVSLSNRIPSFVTILLPLTILQPVSIVSSILLGRIDSW